MRIGIDVDGVIADNHTAWINRVNDCTECSPGIPSRFTPDDLTCWTFWTDLGITKAQLFKHWTPDIYKEVKPYPGAVDAINRIREMGHELYYITTCATYEEYEAKSAWLHQHAFMQAGDSLIPVGCPGVYFQNKADVARELLIQWLVDDSVQNCEEWPNYALLLTRAHNRNLQGTPKRIKDLAEVPGLLTFMAKGLREWDHLHASDDGPMGEEARATPFQTADKAHIPQGIATAVLSPLPTDKQARKDTPVTSGVLDYFSAAIAEVARVSKAGNDQHNPGQALHWARGKSMDHADCIVRHVMERGTIDEDGQRHSAKAAWRALALLQQELEDEGAPMSRASRVV